MWNIYGKSVTRTFLGAFFLGAHIVQMVPEYIWMRHCFFLSVLNMFYPSYPARAVGFRKCKDKQILLNLYFSMYFLTFIGLTFNGNKQTKKRWVESSDAITWWKPSQLKIFIKWWTNMEEECHIYQVIYIEIFLIINVFTIMISRSVYTKMQRGILHVSAASRRFLGILFSWS